MIKLLINKPGVTRMKIKQIKYSKPLNEIPDINNASIDAFVEMEDGITYIIAVGTPEKLHEIMDLQGGFYHGVPWVFVTQLTETSIRNALEKYADDNGFWLKMYHLAGVSGLMSVEKIDQIIKNHLEKR